MHTSLNRDLDRTPMVLLYPLLLTVGLGSFFWLMSVGFNSFLASALPVISSLAVIRLLEIRYPYRHDWLASGREMRTDIAFLLVVQGIAPKLLALGCAILLADSEWLHFEQSPWPGHWPVAAQALLMLVSADLLRYWLHRAAHRVPLLWRFHSIHHQPRKLYSLNVTRFHPAEKALQFAVDTLPFIVLGAGSEVIAAYFVFYAINGFLQHSNLDLHCGPLNYLLSTNDLHRWHHGRDSAMAQCNYGNNLILWDLLFGTYYRPQQHVPRFIGIRGVAQCGFRRPWVCRSRAWRTRYASACTGG